LPFLKQYNSMTYSICIHW